MRPKISFCTTCKGRRHHLEEVYRRNIERTLSYDHVEFVLLDYASPDDLAGWVHSALAEWLERGIVRYFRTDEPVGFDMAHAKNVAHRLATGEILVNLDADNWFEPGFAEEIAAIFAEGARVFAAMQTYKHGCTGRVAVRRADFMSLGGYDEDLRGWGYDDIDFMRRAHKFGLARRRMHPRHGGALHHSDEERFRFVQSKDKHSLHRLNQARSQLNLCKGKIVANVGRSWGAARIIESSDAGANGVAERE